MNRGTPVPEENSGAAPELAAAMRETRAYRDLLAEVLGKFGKQAWTDGMYASVSERTYRKWLARAGMKGTQ